MHYYHFQPKQLALHVGWEQIDLYQKLPVTFALDSYIRIGLILYALKTLDRLTTKSKPS